MVYAMEKNTFTRNGVISMHPIQLLALAVLLVYLPRKFPVGASAGENSTEEVQQVRPHKFNHADLLLREHHSRRRTMRKEGESKRFYLFTMEEINPELAKCPLTVYAALFYQHLLVHPSRELDISQAKFVMLPPYAAWETNWPVYGALSMNVAVEGEYKSNNMEDVFTCNRMTATEALQQVNAAKRANETQSNLFAVVVDHWPDYSLLPEAIYTHPQLSFAKLNSLTTIFRPSKDISLPPSLSERLMRVKHQPKDVTSFATKSYLLSFRGLFASFPSLRSRIGKLHDPSNGIVIIDSGFSLAENLLASLGNAQDHQARGLEYETLMARSNFTLVVRGDVEFSYRLSEAICSGAVPVVITDTWVPPYSQIMPFQEYGILLSEAQLMSQPQEEDYEYIIGKLKSVSADTFLELLQKSLYFCHHHLASVHQQWDTLMELYLSDAIHF